MKSNLKGGESMKLIDKIRPLWGTMPYGEIGKRFGVTAEAVRKLGRRNGLPPKRLTSQTSNDASELAKKDITITQHQRRKKIQDEKYRAIMEALEVEKAKVAVYERTRDIANVRLSCGAYKGANATAVAVLSDWHYGEDVTAESVNELNSYNQEIASTRIAKVFANTEQLINLFSSSVRIDNVVIALLGDFISGNIHEELLESNESLPIEQIIGAQTLIAAGLNRLKAMGKKITVVCKTGNHSRITDKLHCSTETGNSLEYLMYHNIASNVSGVNFVIPKSYLAYLDADGYVMRFHHGNALRFAGGIGGLFIPAYKAIGNWNVSRKADLDVFGHFHQFRDGGQFISNGSVVGYNPYAINIKAVYEKPSQTFFLVDHKRRQKTVTCPIFVD